MRSLQLWLKAGMGLRSVSPQDQSERLGGLHEVTPYDKHYTYLDMYLETI